MNNTTTPVIKDLFISSLRVFFQPKNVALRIKNNDLSWTRALIIYFTLLVISILITNSAFEHYTSELALSNIKSALFQIAYAVIFSFIIRYTMLIFKGSLSNEKTLKLYLIYGGVTGVIYSISLISQMFLHSMESIIFALLIACLGTLWIIFSYWAIITVNDIQVGIKKTAALLLLIFFTFIFSYLTSAIANISW